jgi:hypothetical protein
LFGVFLFCVVSGVFLKWRLLMTIGHDCSQKMGRCGGGVLARVEIVVFNDLNANARPDPQKIFDKNLDLLG